MFDHIAVVFGEPTQATSTNGETHYLWLKEHEIDSFWIKFSLWRLAGMLDH